MTELTLGSLFSGSGGFELAGKLAGIKPKYNSEIEPFPIAVTRKNFPEVKHYGDVSSLSGAELEPVDIITFGSPCQDVSVAGKRAGLESGKRSSLFFQAIRIIKEMREKTNGEYPRYIVWENVPGAFSSNRGEDFRIVLEEICKIKDPEISVPCPGRWSKAGEIFGDGFTVAWRTLDARGWGVPQRRKRIYLVADFAGDSAPKVLFESQSLHGDSEAGRLPWERTPRGSEACPDSAGRVVLNDQGGQRMDVTDDFTCTLRAESHHPPCATAHDSYCLQGNMIGRQDKNGPQGCGWQEGTCYTLNTIDRPAVLPIDNHANDSRFELREEDSIQTLSSRMGTGGNNEPCVAEPSYGIDRATYNQGKNAQFDFSVEEETSPTLVARGANACAKPSPVQYRIRRITPTECARLQGFPDDWASDLGIENPTDEDMQFWAEVFEEHRKLTSPNSKPKTENYIRKWIQNPHSDSAEYKMWGNGIALPCAYFVMKGIVNSLE